MIICIGREFGSGGHEIGKKVADSQLITELASEDNCVFIGRCADYITPAVKYHNILLAQISICRVVINCWSNILQTADIERISLFIAAPFQDRVKRKMELLQMNEKSTITLVRKTDKERKAYYAYYTGRSWGKPHNYDFCINSSNYGIQRTAEILAEKLAQM